MGIKGKREYGTMTAAAAKNLINTVASVSDEMVTHKNPSFAGELWVEINGGDLNYLDSRLLSRRW